MQNPAILYQLAVRMPEADRPHVQPDRRRSSIEMRCRERFGWTLVSLGLRIALSPPSPTCR